MPQRDCLLPWRSALDNACLGLENCGTPRPEARRVAAALFGRLDSQVPRAFGLRSCRAGCANGSHLPNVACWQGGAAAG